MSPQGDYRRELERTLGGLERAGLRRALRPPRGIDLVSNDYLGLAEHPHLRERMREALLTLPAGSTGSRLLSGQRPAFAEIEQRLAGFCGAESALLFGSGYAANQGLLQAVLGEGDLVV